MATVPLRVQQVAEKPFSCAFDDLGKNKRSFWYRLKNFTFEAPKTVVIEGDTIKLVPISPETAAIKTDIEKPPSFFPESSVSILPETTIVQDETEVQILASPETMVSPLPEAIIAEVPTEEVLVSSEKLKKSLEKTRSRFWSRLKNLFSFRRNIDESVLEELEDILIGADIGAKSVQKLIHEVHEAWKSKTITETSQIQDFIKDRLKESLRSLQNAVSARRGAGLPRYLRRRRPARQREARGGSSLCYS